MHELNQVRLIQGGMGVYVSNWRLARAVALARPGLSAGTVSGTALDVVYARLLQLGDPGGNIAQAFAALDESFGTTLGQRIYARYFIEGGKAPTERFAPTPRPLARDEHGTAMPLIPRASSEPLALGLDTEGIELLIAAGFAEVWLAKQGHDGKILINFLNKIELPLIYTLYGAMLAGVDGVIVGAGNPDGLAGICSRLARHEAVSRKLTVLYQEAGDEFQVAFDPHTVCEGIFATRPLRRPDFLAIVSQLELAQALDASHDGAPDGFIIENYTAGGHNANPSGPLQRDERGQPIYSTRDNPDLAAIAALGRPFWLAGGYGSAEGLWRARDMGAHGVQVGSAFAMAEESGLRADYKAALLAALRDGASDVELIQTTLYSPTGFSFKVVQLSGTLADPEVYAKRRRVCDIGLLQQPGIGKPDNDGERRLFQRCPASPIAGYVQRRGLERNTEERRCLCNGLLACVGLGQTWEEDGVRVEEPAIITLGSSLAGVRRLSRQGQHPYQAHDVVADILGDVSQS
jgi:NAD(P)H-dependent flavin oxidoreductase YrpB (nitropropane dioxygenase family)